MTKFCHNCGAKMDGEPGPREEEGVTNFERLTQSPEALAAWLENLRAVNTPWERAFDRVFCAECQNQNCDQCPEEEYRVNPLWWLGQKAEEQEDEP